MGDGSQKICSETLTFCKDHRLFTLYGDPAVFHTDTAFSYDGQKYGLLHLSKFSFIHIYGYNTVNLHSCHHGKKLKGGIGKTAGECPGLCPVFVYPFSNFHVTVCHDRGLGFILNMVVYRWLQPVILDGKEDNVPS